MDYWLLVERLENRLVDEREGFRRFGIPARKEGLASQIKAGDKLIFYVSSGLSMISDIRIATADGVQRLRYGGEYDTAYPLAISTRPEILLPRNQWLPLREVAERLTLTAGKDWRQALRVSLRRLAQADGLLLHEEVTRRADHLTPAKC